MSQLTNEQAIVPVAKKHRSWVGPVIAISALLHGGLLVAAALAPKPMAPAPDPVVRVEVIQFQAGDEAKPDADQWVGKGRRAWAWVSLRKLQSSVGL